MTAVIIDEGVKTKFLVTTTTIAITIVIAVLIVIAFTRFLFVFATWKTITSSDNSNRSSSMNNVGVDSPPLHIEKRPPSGKSWDHSNRRPMHNLLCDSLSIDSFIEIDGNGYIDLKKGSWSSYSLDKQAVKKVLTALFR